MPRSIIRGPSGGLPEPNRRNVRAGRPAASGRTANPSAPRGDPRLGCVHRIRAPTPSPECLGVIRAVRASDRSNARLRAAPILDRRRHSSAVEQLFRKQQVLGSNPSVGSTTPLLSVGRPTVSGRMVGTDPRVTHLQRAACLRTRPPRRRASMRPARRCAARPKAPPSPWSSRPVVADARRGSRDRGPSRRPAKSPCIR